MLTFASAELKNVWFSNFDQSMLSCCVDFSGFPGSSYLKDDVTLVDIEPVTLAAVTLTIDARFSVRPCTLFAVKSPKPELIVFFLAII